MANTVGYITMSKTCETCDVVLTDEEEADSERFIGGDRYFCNEHLNQKMDW